MTVEGLPEAELIRRYVGGESTRQLARAYHTSHTTVRGRLVALGVRMRSRGDPPYRGHKRGGPLSLTGEGYLRTADRDGKACFVHRGCWGAHFGPIPPGYNIHHRDEDRRHNAIENLECLTKSEHGKIHGCQHGRK